MALPSRGSSPLSDLSSSPSVTSPRRNRSSSISSTSTIASNHHHPHNGSTNRDRGDSYDELSDEEGTSISLTTSSNKKKGGGRAAAGAGAGAGVNTNTFDPNNLPTAQCQWADCGEEFYELEPMIEHLHALHAFPTNPADIGTKKALIYQCDWTGCPRRGKNQTSKFALLGHLRSHTGEKPFNCPRPECDKAFTRTDALQKHMRIQHHEVILPSRRPPSKKRKTGRGASIGSDDDDETSTINGGDGDAGGAGGEESREIVWTDEELELFDQFPEAGKGFLAYVVGKAKWAYLVGEHEGLLNELEALGTREAELRAECEELLKGIMRKEVAADEDDPSNEETLETYLNRYSHEPRVMPSGWSVDLQMTK